jgi:trehalose 6-phosphate phosphatase
MSSARATGGIDTRMTDALAPFVERPGRAALLLDFDGTLSPIVDVPAEARPLPGASEVLEALADRFAVVAVVSGRPASFLEPLLPAGVVISGIYGLETVRNGVRSDHAGAAGWRDVVAEAVRHAKANGPVGMAVEPKGFSLTLHYREHPGLGPAVREWAAAEAKRSGLVLRRARMSFELHPPVAVDKGTAVHSLVTGVEAVCFIGDDRGDLPAFDTLDQLEARGVEVLRVAVGSAEAPGDLIERADLVVDGPRAVLHLLRQLASGTPSSLPAPDRPGAP